MHHLRHNCHWLKDGTVPTRKWYWMLRLWWILRRETITNLPEYGLECCWKTLLLLHVSFYPQVLFCVCAPYGQIRKPLINYGQQFPSPTRINFCTCQQHMKFDSDMCVPIGPIRTWSAKSVTKLTLNSPPFFQWWWRGLVRKSELS